MKNKQRIATAFALSLLAFGCVTEPGPGRDDEDGGTRLDGGRQDSGGDGDGELDGGHVGRDAAGDASGGDSDASCSESPSTGLPCEDGTFGTCESASDCSGNLKCSSEGSCVLCRDDRDCPMQGTVCGESHRCEAAPCKANTDCPHEEYAHCDVATGSCAGCTSDGECARFGKVCDEVAGICGDCVVGEDARCTNGLACVNGPTVSFAGLGGVGGCDGRQQNAGVACQSCSADGECAEGYGCVMTLFNGKAYNTFCLAKKAAIGGTCPAGTPATVKAVFNPRSTLWKQQDSAGAQEFCAPNPANGGTCSGLQTFGDRCSAEQEQTGACGHSISEGVASGICVGPAGQQVCTYSCKVASDCITSCVGVTPRYCDPF